jgi:hypothetical protein
VKRTPVRFSLDDAQRAGNEWRFNCGPGALCALLGTTPDEIRPRLLDFERKGYTNPTLMKSILGGLGVRFNWVVVPETYPPQNLWLDNSLIRVQWAGPWTEPTAHFAERYRHTHWIACRHNGTAMADVFDINAMCVGGWMPVSEWENKLVPWLLKECEPKADGRWWQTHRVQIAERKEGGE